MNIIISPKKNLKGAIRVPGDKSISHRSIMLGAIAQGETHITGFLMGEDCLSTIACFRKLGVCIDVTEQEVVVHGKGLYGLEKPNAVLDVGNSGTTLRLLSGILAGQSFCSTLTGDASIQKRPMNRVATPLSQMGASFHGEKDNKNGLFAPFTLSGGNLKGIAYTMPMASAQVKSALLLAGLYAQGDTYITEPVASRNHTEIMLAHMGADIQNNNGVIHCRPGAKLQGQEIAVPGDISSAAYFLVGATILSGSDLTLQNVGLNPSRTGIIDVLNAMGANIEILNQWESCGELAGDIRVQSAPLTGVVVGGADIPRLIDEIPVLAIAACFANGTTIIKDAQELKVKESNRIQTVVTELRKLGADIQETEDGMIIHGGRSLSGCTITTYHDHRIAMAMAIAALGAKGETCITDAQCANISFPSFYTLLS